MVNTTTLGNTGIKVGKVGHGLMMMTWKPTPVADDVAFEAIRASLDSVPTGCKMLLNSGEFYGVAPRTANLELIARFFEAHPQYADKAFLSVKGGTEADSLEPDTSPANLRRSVDVVLKALRGTKSLDLFECARVDPRVPVEQAIATLSGFVKEGLFKYIGMSECRAETLRKGNSVHPIAAVEIEVSPWSYTPEVKDVIKTAEELGVTVVAYSPLGRGFLTGQIKRPEDMEEGDYRRGLSRFSEENMKHNFAVVDALSALAERKGISSAQLCIAWVAGLSSRMLVLPGSSAKKRTLENISAADITLTAEENADIERVLAEHVVSGGRYVDGAEDKLALWG